MEYYSVIKKNTFESVLMRWIKLEPIIQSEVSQKEKHQYSILMHIYGIYKDGNDNPVCETAKETQTMILTRPHPDVSVSHLLGSRITAEFLFYFL